MTKTQNFDVVIIGSGSAGFSAAEAARALGASVCLIEKDKFGGECPNYACIPSKAWLKAAKVYRSAKQSREYGVSCQGIGVDFEAMVKYREKVVSSITGGAHGERYQKIAQQLNITLIIGSAALIDEHTLEVGHTLIKGKSLIIATGTVDYLPPISGLDQAHFLGWKQALLQKRQPKSMAIIGGGAVGSELATFFGTLGTRVLLFEFTPTILPKEDEELARLAHQALKTHNVEVFGSARILEVIDGRGGVYGLKVEQGGAVQTHAVEQVVVAAGRRSNVADLNLESTGVALDDRQTIKTDDEQRTNVRHIFAAGDVDGGLQLTHTAHREGAVAGHNAALQALGKRAEKMKSDLRVVPRVTFVDPEVASVGQTSQELKAKMGQLLVGRYAIANLGRAVTDNQKQGLVKIIAHPKTRKILGCHIMSPHAGEMIHEAALAMHLNTTVDKLGSLIHAFPTYSEALMAAANSVELE
ncbi:dihydrolipoyl dehydrogenase [Patescibacteria group bacterium]|nr:dihydrolipoyl dehydrogenase [Patescibacteria group bacterium]MBU1705136.1 dihydrolipoyl dehydrogenase [Patescibacteria group bacterium]